VVTVRPPLVVSKLVRVVVPETASVPPSVVAPAPTVRLLSVSPLKVGLAVVLMFWMVFTLPLLVVKLVELKLAIPFWVVEASLMVIVLALAEALFTVRAPNSPFIELTPPLVQALNWGPDTVETRHRPLLAAVTWLMGLVPLPTKTELGVRLVRPVPPLVTLRELLRLRALKVGLELLLMFWGKPRVKLLPVWVTSTWAVIPVIDTTAGSVALMVVPFMAIPCPAVRLTAPV